MKIGILGSGAVGKALAEGFLKLGYEVKIGTRDESKLNEFTDGKNITAGSFSDAASFGNLIVLAVKGDAAEKVINIAGKENFSGKIVIDVTNPLKFENEQIPKLFIAYPDSLGKKIQELLPSAKVVKAFNTVTSAYMCNPKLEEGAPDMFIVGNDEGKVKVKEIAERWGWNVIDIGAIQQAHLLESLAMIWIRYGFMNNHWTHAFKLLKK